jgi:hypothetical protein
MNHLKYSNTKRYAYEQACRTLGEEILAPILDVVTRWNSTYVMLYRALQMRRVRFEVCCSVCRCFHVNLLSLL